ncbi:MAG: hypothetical protein EOP46_00235 [Sphingobacteriaceae bacterium]|nr:MAG: hypothetical protein EOP46_00235 [Sphingobacteriaceae bacterium]
MDNQVISKETFEEIESYLLGLMDKETRLQFESRMAHDAALLAEVRLQQKLFAAVEAGSFTSVPQNVKSIGFSRRYVAWFSAAAAILVFAVAAFWFSKRFDRQTENLYAAFYQADPGLPVEMGAADSTAYLFYDGMISYKEGDYKQALKKWGKLEKRQVLRDTLQYYKAMAQLNQGAIDEGITTLTPIADKAGTAYYREANWYLALAYLKKGDKKNAQVILKRIPDHPGVLSLLNEL